MKRILCLSIVLLPIIAISSGKIEVVGSDTVNFGKYNAWEKKVALYKIKNVGDEVLRIIKVRKTCGCASATCDKTELQPGATGTVEVVILPDSIFGLYSKNTFVESSDTDCRFLKLNVGGNAIPLLEVQPKEEVYIGRVPSGKELKRSFVLTATGKNVALGKPSVESTYPVETVLSASDGKPSAKFQFDITLKPSDKSGDLNCTVTLPVISPTNHAPVKITITGRIGVQLQALPGIARVPLSDAPVNRSFQLRALGQRTRVLDSNAIALPKVEGVEFAVKQHHDGHSLLVTATFSPDFTKQLLADETIPLSFSVQNAASAKLICKIRR